MSKNRGLSLLDVVVTTAIMSILMGVAIPNYRQYKRNASQLEAKTLLAEVYTTQHNYNTVHMRYHPNLKTIGFAPSGPIRYNIGAIWSGTHHSLHPTSAICKTCNGDEDNDNPCCMLSRFAYSKHGSTTFTNTSPNHCFGDEAGIQASLSGACSGLATKTSSIGASDYTANDGEFYYYATGCVSDGRRKPTELDVWMISDRKYLVNVKNGASGDTTCSHS